MEMKRCKLCGIDQPPSCFYLNLGIPRAQCKKCYLAKKRAYGVAYQQRRRRADPVFRLAHQVSKQISKALGGKKNHRSRTILVGYSIDELRRHLERQFSNGMNWSNYGSRWHVDHIVPIGDFQIRSIEEKEKIAACWALSNLRPLDRRANQAKSNRRLFLL